MSVRTLIVEDQQGKIAKVVALLTGTGICNRADIEIAQTGVQARRLLREQQFDLMILDVVLPNRPEDAPQRNGGVELLRELMDRDGFRRPSYIVGLTAFPDA